ncbi:MAG: GntR family transcriptional regulator [Chloroflexi bacterium]|nr:GntR family transcriptional regulator [Chloroflexota bacterium]
MSIQPGFPRITLDSAGAEPPYRQIAAQIGEAIRLGRLAPGAALPPVRALARELEVNANTVSRAYVELGQQGLLAARRGGGTRVAERAGERMRATQEARLREVASHALTGALALGYEPEALEAALAVAVARWRAALAAPLPAAPSPAGQLARPGELRCVGSHVLSVELLRAQLAAGRPPVRLATRFPGSLEGLMALAHGEADLAGCHLLDEETGDYNAPFVRRLLPGQPVLLAILATRQQGFMLPPGQATEQIDLAAVARQGWRFATRQRGSGTRVLFDHLLRQAGVPASQIAGYQDELPGHLAVAEAVATGQAEVGLGIEAAAQAHGLAFAPVAREPYELAIPAALAERPEVQALLDTLKSEALQRGIAALGGYDSRRTGQVRYVA